MFTSPKNNYLDKKKSILLVIAHPDDEAMFFGPLLLEAKKKGCDMTILCLSNGNFHGQGKIREQELFSSANIFSISRDCTLIIDDAKLQDGMDNNWSHKQIADIVLKSIITRNQIDVIVTFDADGISGHPNHIATFKGVEIAISKLNKSTSQHKNIIGIKLVTTNIIRKFMGIFDALFSLIFFNDAIINWDLFTIQAAMNAHSSQNVWYRRLFVVFSRYSFVNTFQRI